MPNEEEITDRPQFLWMMLHYLKRIGPAKAPADAQWAALYVAPNGDKWIAVRKGSTFYARRHRS